MYFFSPSFISPFSFSYTSSHPLFRHTPYSPTLRFLPLFTLPFFHFLSFVVTSSLFPLFQFLSVPASLVFSSTRNLHFVSSFLYLKQFLFLFLASLSPGIPFSILRFLSHFVSLISFRNTFLCHNLSRLFLFLIFSSFLNSRYPFPSFMPPFLPPFPSSFMPYYYPSPPGI